MGITTGIAIYLVIWWTILFAVLPIGVQRMENPPAGHDRGAPQTPLLLKKAIITSLVAAALWLAFFAIYQLDIFSFRRWADTL